MSEHDADTMTQDTERAERPVLRRYAPLTGIEGRTIDALIVPWDTPADVSDDGIRVYREEWAPSAFNDQIVAAHRLKVLMNFEHQRGIANVVGRGVQLRSESDGLHGTFEILPTSAGDTALELVNANVLDGISLEAYAKKSINTERGTVRRVKAHLDGAALCRNPAFKDARVLAVREDDLFTPEVVIDEAMLPVDMNPALVERLRRAGISLPDRYQAHPAENGHPDLIGTPEDGTRHDLASTSSEVPNHVPDTD